MANLPLAFAELLVGGVLIDAGIKGASIGDVVKGQATVAPLDPSSAAAASSSAGSTTTAGEQPQGTALKGAEATTWAHAILAALGAPATQANLNSMIDWFNREGGGGENNPLNTTLQTTGATGSINSAGVKNYDTPADGVAATVKTLAGGYPAIVAALKAGTGLSNAGSQVSSELSTWSGGGYSSL